MKDEDIKRSVPAINQLDEMEIDGKMMKREPSEGWTYVMLFGPTSTFRMDDQPSPKDYLHFHKAEEPNADATVFTLVGKDDERSEAYYFKGAWGFGQPSADETPTLEA